jgi:hypothetical protein
MLASFFPEFLLLKHTIPSRKPEFSGQLPDILFAPEEDFVLRGQGGATFCCAGGAKTQQRIPET